MANAKIAAVLANLTKEVTEARGAMASAAVYIHGVPTLVQTAVDAAVALADLTPEQQAIFDDLIAQLDAGEQEVLAALSANAPAPAPPTP